MILTDDFATVSMAVLVFLGTGFVNATTVHIMQLICCPDNV